MATTICRYKRPRRHRLQVNLTIDPHVLERVKQFMGEIGETSLSNFVEGLFECVLRDTCEGCPGYEELPDDEKAKIVGKFGVGKWEFEDD